MSKGSKHSVSVAPCTGVSLYLHAWKFQHFLTFFSSSLTSLSLLPVDASPVLLIFKIPDYRHAWLYTGNVQVFKLMIKYCNIVGTHFQSLRDLSQCLLLHPSPVGRWLSGECLRLNGWKTRVISVSLLSFHNIFQKKETYFIILKQLCS